MSSMLKLLTVVVLVSSVSATSLKEKVLEFERKNINPQIQVDKMEVAHEVELTKGWTAFVIDLTITMQGQTRDVKDILFTDGTVVTRELMDLTTGRSYNRVMEEYTYPILTNKYYDKKYLIAGKQGAKNKIVVFSSPGCPYCVQLMPGLIEQVKGKKDVALYYIASPSQISMAMIAAKLKGAKDVEYKIYSTLLQDRQLIALTNDIEQSIKIVSEATGVQITKEDIEAQNVKERVEAYMQLSQEAAIRATPTIFVNGKVDLARTKMQELLR